MRGVRRATGVAWLVLAGCGGSPGPQVERFDVAAEFAKVTAAHTALIAARSGLEQASTPAGPAATAASGGAPAVTAYDEAYAAEQRTLAAFLNQALNLAPARPETRQALAMYADAAVANANFLLRRGGDLGQAVPALTAAETAYRALGLAPPPALTAALTTSSRPATPTAIPTATHTPHRPPHHARHRRR